MPKRTATNLPPHWDSQAVQKQYKKQFRDFIAEQDMDFFAVLTVNRPASLPFLRDKFGEWLGRVDRKLLGRNWQEDDAARTFAIAIPEHLNSNTHLNVLVRLPFSFRDLPETAVGSILDGIWGKLVPSGHAHVEAIKSTARVSSYASKELWRIDDFDRVILSTEFQGN